MITDLIASISRTVLVLLIAGTIAMILLQYVKSWWLKRQYPDAAAMYDAALDLIIAQQDELDALRVQLIQARIENAKAHKGGTRGFSRS